MAGQPSSPTEGRVSFRDIKPYAVVDSLDQLHGPPAVWSSCRTRCCGHLAAAGSTSASPAVSVWPIGRC
jgi:hypothetical protein